MAWWQFWKKRNPPFVIDPMTAALLPLDYFLERKKPFTDWRPPGTQILSQHEDEIKCMVWGYQLFTYLKLVEEKFGGEIAAIIREYQIITLNRLPDRMGDQASQLLQIIERAVAAGTKNPIKIPDHTDVQAPIQLPMAIHLLCFEMKDSPYYVPPDRRTKESVDNLKLPDMDASFALAECLAHGKDSAVEAFAPMVQMLELKPETVAGLRREAPSAKDDIPPAELVWSADPGCFERHLQRKYQNPLFPPVSRVVTQEEVDAARARDATEAQTLWQNIPRAIEPLKGGPVTYSQLAEAREQLDRLMQRAAEVGDRAAEKAAAQLYWALIRDMERALAADEEASQALQKANEDYVRRVLPYTNRFVAQVCRKDSPIKRDEVLPALLTEDIESIKKFLTMVANDDELRNLHKNLPSEALELITQTEATGAIIPDADTKLEVLGIRRNR